MTIIDKAELIYRSLHYMEGEAANIEKELRGMNHETNAALTEAFNGMERRLEFLLAFIRGARDICKPESH